MNFEIFQLIDQSYLYLIINVSRKIWFTFFYHIHFVHESLKFSLSFSTYYFENFPIFFLNHEIRMVFRGTRCVLLDEGIAGSEPNTVSLRREIAVLDENDNPPVYHGRPYAARVPESAHVGGLLVPPGTITITDRDGGVNADVHVECVSASRDDDVCDVFNVSAEKVGFTRAILRQTWKFMRT